MERLAPLQQGPIISPPNYILWFRKQCNILWYQLIKLTLQNWQELIFRVYWNNQTDHRDRIKYHFKKVGSVFLYRSNVLISILLFWENTKYVPHKMKRFQQVQFSFFETSQKLIDAHIYIHDMEDRIGERRINVNQEKRYCIILPLAKRNLLALNLEWTWQSLFQFLKPVKSLLQLPLIV